MVQLNVDDASSKVDVLNSVWSRGTAGYEVKNIFNFSKDSLVRISFRYDSSYYRSALRAQEAKDRVLGELLAIAGLKITCDGIETKSGSRPFSQPIGISGQWTSSPDRLFIRLCSLVISNICHELSPVILEAENNMTAWMLCYLIGNTVLGSTRQSCLLPGTSASAVL